MNILRFKAELQPHLLAGGCPELYATHLPILTVPGLSLLLDFCSLKSWTISITCRPHLYWSACKYNPPRTPTPWEGHPPSRHFVFCITPRHSTACIREFERRIGAGCWYVFGKLCTATCQALQHFTHVHMHYTLKKINKKKQYRLGVLSMYSSICKACICTCVHRHIENNGLPIDQEENCLHA